MDGCAKPIFRIYVFLRNLNTINNKNYLVSISNLQGICLWQSTFNSEETIVLKNLANLPQGFLILSIRSGGNRRTDKVD